MDVMCARVKPAVHDRIKRAAEKLDLSKSRFIAEAAGSHARDVLAHEEEENQEEAA